MTQIQWTKPVCQLDSDGLYLGQAEAELDIYARDGSYIMPGLVNLHVHLAYIRVY